MPVASIPLGCFVDSYKTSHPYLYPLAKQRTAYGEFRRGFDGDAADQRILVFGLRYIIEAYIMRQWTMEDVEKSEAFYSTHNVGFTPFPFPAEIFRRIVTECNGFFPVRIDGIQEGQTVYPHTPIYTVTADDEWSVLVTWLETILSMVWYPTTVATLSRRIKDVIQEAFLRSVDEHMHRALIDSRLHDFGFRGCASVEQAMIGGTAHLLNFSGTDTTIAAYHAQYELNNGNPVAQSIPATEHSVMTAHASEKDAILAAISEFGSGAFACVMDSYDYTHALQSVLPSVAAEKLEKGGFMILRPDSGDPLKVIIEALEALNEVFGSTINQKGFKVLKGCGVIHGDGITSSQQVENILNGIMASGYSAQNIALGMGSGLLYRVYRDTMSFATKLCHVCDLEGIGHDICKSPKTDPTKNSLPGLFSVQENGQGIPTVYPKEEAPNGTELLVNYYDKGLPVGGVFSITFDKIRAKANSSWNCLPKTANSISAELQDKIDRVGQSRG